MTATSFGAVVGVTGVCAGVGWVGTEAIATTGCVDAADDGAVVPGVDGLACAAPEVPGCFGDGLCVDAMDRVAVGAAWAPCEAAVFCVEARPCVLPLCAGTAPSEEPALCADPAVWAAPAVCVDPVA